MFSLLYEDVLFMIMAFLSPLDQTNFALTCKTTAKVYKDRLTLPLKNGHKINPFQLTILEKARHLQPGTPTIFLYDISSGKSLAAILLAHRLAPSIIVTTANLFLHMRDALEEYTNCKYLMLRSDVCKNIKKTVENLDLKETPIVVTTNRTLGNLSSIADKFNAIIDEFHINVESAIVMDFVDNNSLITVGLTASTLKYKHAKNVKTVTSDYAVKIQSKLIVTSVICYIPSLERMGNELSKKYKKFHLGNGNKISEFKPNAREDAIFVKRCRFKATHLINELMFQHKKTIIFHNRPKYSSDAYLKFLDVHSPGIYQEAIDNNTEFYYDLGCVPSVPVRLDLEIDNEITEVRLLTSRGNFKQRKQFFDEMHETQNNLILFAPLTYVKVGLDFSFADCGVIIGEYTMKELKQIIGRILRINNSNSEITIYWVRNYMEGSSGGKITKKLKEEVFPKAELTDPILMHWEENDCVFTEYDTVKEN